jgi:hypothetical protein
VKNREALVGHKIVKKKGLRRREAATSLLHLEAQIIHDQTKRSSA